MVSLDGYSKKNRDTLKAQAYELQSSLDLLIAMIKQNHFDDFVEQTKEEPNLVHYLVNNVYFPLHVACEFNRLPFVKHMVEECCVDVNSRCKLTGFTPIMYAAQTGSTQIVEFLTRKEFGVDLLAKSFLEIRRVDD